MGRKWKKKFHLKRGETGNYEEETVMSKALKEEEEEKAPYDKDEEVWL